MIKPFALTCVALLAGGCVLESTTITVTDIDNGYAPVANASVDHYRLPRRTTDAWPTSPSETRTTDADGKVKFKATSGRYVVRAPGKAPAAIMSTFAPQSIELSVSSGK